MVEPVAERSARPIAIVRHPIYTLFLPVPVVCFIGAVLTDLSYLGSGGNLLWVNFSTWLLTAGLVFGAIAGVVLLIDLIRGVALNRVIGWAQFLLLLAAWIVEFINSLVHSRDGWTAVAGAGVILSIVGAFLILVAAWLWRPAMEVVS
jgi:uncharacterized membrane protein